MKYIGSRSVRHFMRFFLFTIQNSNSVAVFCREISFHKLKRAFICQYTRMYDMLWIYFHWYNFADGCVCATRKNYCLRRMCKFFQLSEREREATRSRYQQSESQIEMQSLVRLERPKNTFNIISSGQ